MVDIPSFRNGMALLASAVNVITTDGPQGLAGFTATAVSSVTDQPPTLLVCMNRASYTHPLFTGNGVLCVNVLTEAQKDVSAIFADRQATLEERFAKVGWSRLQTGSPVLEGAMVSFDCRITHTHDAGSHSIFICDVVGLQQSQSSAGLVYFNRSYHGIGPQAAGVPAM
ncbi:MAG: flavin reductase [Burkholderiaceae bacterium]|nr:flavin reductase [Burkholderiaceae bacterium]